MKRLLIFLMLTISLAVTAQTTPSYKNIKITGNAISPTAPFINVQETTGAVNKINKTDLEITANKDNGTLTTSTTTYPTSGVVKAELDNIKSQINPNTYVVTDAGYTLVINSFTLNSGWSWKINNVDNTNASPVVITVPLATSGYQRVDLIVLNASNTAIRVAGVEAVTPISPAVPLNTIMIASIFSDSTVHTPVIPKPKYPVSQLLRNGITDYSPSEDVVYDALALKAATTYVDGKLSDTAYDATSWDGVTGISPSKNAVRDKIESVLLSTKAYKTYFVNSVTGNNTTGAYEDSSKPYATIDYVLALPAFKDGDIIYLVYVYNNVSPTVYPLNGQIPDKSVTIKSDGYVQLVFSNNTNSNLYLNASTVYISLTIDLPHGQIINERSGGAGVVAGITSGQNNIYLKADYIYLNTSNVLFSVQNAGYTQLEARSIACKTTVIGGGSGFVDNVTVQEFNCLGSDASIGGSSNRLVTIYKISGSGNYIFRNGIFNVGDISTTGTCQTTGFSEKILINFMNSTITSTGGFEFGFYYGGSATITGNIKSTPLLNLYGNEYGYITINFINFVANLGTGQIRHYGGPVTLENCSIKSTNSPLAFWNASAGATITLKNSTFEVINSVPLVTGGAGGACILKVAGISTNATMLSDQNGTGVTVTQFTNY